MDKLGLVYCIYPEQYEIFDERINKPICIKNIENGIETGSMVFQELDEVNFKQNPLTYFPPNNVGILLSVTKKHLAIAKEMFRKEIDPSSVNHSFVSTKQEKKEFLKQKSIIVADYIELIQTCIVFGYTALEAFTNLSITDEFEYKVYLKTKGVTEIYNKTAIERWIGVNDKLSKILPEIYKTKNITTTKFWSHFIKLEKYRHDIIHQKSIESTALYKPYFNKDIFDICSCPEIILKFFYDSHATKQKTNPLWPWLINKEKEFPLTTDFTSRNFEVVGNLFEGKKKKST